MKLDEALSVAEDKIRACLREERTRLVAEIQAMRRQHAAKGLLRSGATLQRIRDLGIESQSRRIETVFSSVRSAIEQVALPVKDAQTLMSTIMQFFPENLDDQGEHIRKAVAEAGTPNALQQLLSALADARINELQKAEADLKLFLNGLGQSVSRPSESRVFGAFEIVLLLATLVLIALWIMNPSGQYEPYLALVATIVTGLDLVRKWRRK